MFGTLSHVNHFNLIWTVLDESTIYKSRDLVNVQIPALPDSAVTKRAFDIACVAQVSAIDQSDNDTLM